MTSTVISPGYGSNWQTAINVAESDVYFGSGSAPADTLTLHDLTPNDPVYIQLIGGQEGWGSNVFVAAKRYPYHQQCHRLGLEHVEQREGGTAGLHGHDR